MSTRSLSCNGTAALSRRVHALPLLLFAVILVFVARPGAADSGADPAKKPPFQDWVMYFPSDGCDGISIAPSDDFNFSGPFTLEAWAYPDPSAMKLSFIFSKNVSDTGYSVRLCDGKYSFDWHAQSMLSRSSAVPEQWTHVCAVAEKNEGRIYLNGQLDAKADMPQPVESNKLPFRIGGSPFGREIAWKGRIGQVRVWSRALTAEEIARAASGAPVENGAGLVAFWPLDVKAGEDVRDKSGRAHTGRASGTAWVKADGPSPVVKVEEETSPTQGGTAPGVSLLAKAEQFQGKVLTVRSGDLFFCQRDGGAGAQPAWIHLHGVVCPLAAQPYGKAAKTLTEKLARGQMVDVRIVGMDAQGGAVAEVTLADGRDLAVELLNAGLAWCNPNSQKAASYAPLEAAARTVKMGLWADPKPTPPWAVVVEEPRKAPANEALMNCVVVVRTPDGLGSGFFITSSGLVVTNHHVVGDSGTVEVATRGSQKLSGKVLQTDVKRDLALIQVQGRNFPHLSLANVSEADVGADVIAIGSPLGLQWSLSKGVVSAMRKDDDILYVQTDTAINEGNSGGPLILVKTGKVIGVNAITLMRRDNRGVVAGTQGLNFAVAASEIRAAFRNLRLE